MLDGDDAVRTLMRYNTDKVFFATGGVSENGYVSAVSPSYSLLHRVALNNTKESFYLVDKSKTGLVLKHNIAPLNKIGTVISDYEFSPETKAACPDTRFIKV